MESKKYEPSPAASSDVSSAKQEALFLAAYAALIFLHYPSLLLHGRVYAEEGTVYLRGAWSGSIVRDLFSPHLGYLALWSNFCGLLVARVFPLQDAAFVLTWCAFGIQLLAGYLVLQCERFSTLRTRALALSVLLLAANFEVWLNTINSQFYLVVCIAVILISNPERHKLLRNVVLALAPLSGPMVVVVAPWFLLRAILAKTRAAWMQACIFIGCSVVQLVVISTQIAAHTRQTAFQPSGIAPEYLVRFVLRPFGSILAESIGATVILNQTYQFWAHRLHFHLSLHWPALLLCVVVDLLWISLLFWITNDPSDRSPWWLLTMALAAALFAMYGAAGGTYQLVERYTFASSVLIGLSLVISSAARTKASARHLLATALLVCFLFSGFLDFLYFHSWESHQRPPGPDWRAQAQQWQRDSGTTLPVWPRGWTLYLPPHH